MFQKVVIFLAIVAFAVAEIDVGDPCAPDCLHESTGQHEPHPQDCTKFYMCSHHIVTLHNCSDGLYFNPTLETCDWPDSAGCTADPDFDCTASDETTEAPTTEAPTTEEPTTAEPTTAEPEPTTEDTTIDLPEEPDFGDDCAPDCTNYPTGTYIAHPQDCSSYFLCYHGFPFLESCPNGYEFNPVLQICDFPSTAGCTADPDLECGTTDTDTTTSTEAAETTEAEVTTEKATTEEATTEAVEECVPPCPSASAIYPDPRDCQKYFQCVDGIPHEISCNFFLEYDPASQLCTIPEFAECDASPDAPCVAVTNPPTTTAETTTTEEPTTTTTTEEPTTEEPTTVAGECTPTCPVANGKYPDPRDCTKFYECVDWVLHQRTCSYGYEYNASKGTCTPPSEANCTADPDAPCE